MWPAPRFRGGCNRGACATGPIYRGRCAMSPVRCGPAAGTGATSPAVPGLLGSVGHVLHVTPRAPYRERRAPPSRHPHPTRQPGNRASRAGSRGGSGLDGDFGGLQAPEVSGQPEVSKIFSDHWFRRGRARSLRLLGLPAPPAGPWPSGARVPLAIGAAHAHGPASVCAARATGAPSRSWLRWSGRGHSWQVRSAGPGCHEPRLGAATRTSAASATFPRLIHAPRLIGGGGVPLNHRQAWINRNNRRVPPPRVTLVLSCDGCDEHRQARRTGGGLGEG
jgi:hypothetical protein